MKMTAFRDIEPCSLVMMRETLHTSETSVHFETSRRCVPKDCHDSENYSLVLFDLYFSDTITQDFEAFSKFNQLLICL
jgi:hypothetical protein